MGLSVFLKENLTRANLLCERRYNQIIKKEYLKVTLPCDDMSEECYQRLRAAAQHHFFYFFVKPKIMPTKGLIAFDMDSTFVKEEGIDEIAHVLGISDKIAALTQQVMEGKLDFDTSFTQRIRMLKGTPKSILVKVCDTMTISPGLAIILPVIRAKGFKIAIISGGLDLFTGRLKERYHLDYAFSNNVAIEHNLLTDKIISPIMNSMKKKQTLIMYN